MTWADTAFWIAIATLSAPVWLPMLMLIGCGLALVVFMGAVWLVDRLGW